MRSTLSPFNISDMQILLTTNSPLESNDVLKTVPQAAHSSKVSSGNPVMLLIFKNHNVSFHIYVCKIAQKSQERV